MKKRNNGFILTEALIALMLVSSFMVFEYDQIAAYKKQDNHLKHKYHEAKKAREDAAKKWQQAQK